jgi:5-(carboxyamino)imidazole ribonucleotide synthase
MVKLGIIGGGQLGLMLCESALQIYFITHIYIFSDKKDDISCNILKDNPKVILIYNKYNEYNLIEFSKLCTIITYEFENINIEYLKNIKTPIYPNIKYLQIIQDKYIQKTFLFDSKLPVGPFTNINTIDDIYNFIKIYNYPIIIKARKGSFDGRGNIVINNEINLNTQIKNITNLNNYYIESFIDFENEISICGCKKHNKIIYYEPVKNIHKKSILFKTIYNKTIPEHINNKIKNIYTNILNIIDTKGVICVEFFQKNNEIYINEIALRVHNTYHISLDCCNISQFDLHLKSILDLDIIKPKFITQGIMYNIISNMQNYEDIIDKIKNNTIIYKNYHKKNIGIRKIGHINVII